MKPTNVFSIFAIVFQLGVSANASPNFDCGDLKKAQLKITIHTSNLANINTTRTPEGGPYKKKTLSCHNQECSIITIKSFITKYVPGHSDASAEGYVNFPDISPTEEKVSLDAAIVSIEAMAQSHICGSEIAVQTKESLMIRYSKETVEIRDDIFNFTPNHKLISWNRDYENGTTEVRNFMADGTILK